MTSFENFFSAAARKAEDPDEKDQIYRLRRMAIDRVDMVDAGANKRTFLIRKDEGATMKTADMIPGAEGIKNAAGVIVTKADAMAGADEDLQKLIEKMEGAEGKDADLVSKLKDIAKVLSSVAKQVEPPKAEAAPPAEGAPPPAAPAAESEEEKAKATAKAEADVEAEKIAKAAAKAELADPFDVISAELDVIQKAGRRMSKGNMEIFTKAMDLLQKLAGNLTPEEKKVAQEKVKAIAKAVDTTPATPAHIQDGKSKPAELPVPAPKGSGWTTYEDINQ